MTFELDILDAKCGDCIIVNYSNGGEVRHILIDGGFHGVYEDRLRPRLIKMKEELELDKPVEFEIAILSHIDADHIVGLLKLTKEIHEENSGPNSPAIIKKFWHNTFAKLTGDNELASLRSASEAVVTASNENLPVPFESLSRENSDGRAELILASIKQGDKLSRNLVKLGLDGNQPFATGLVLAGETYQKHGMELKILGPSLKRLNKLREKWDPNSDPIELAELTDKSVANLSSIIVLMTYDEKTVLFTGDARGDDIIEGLKEADLLVDGTCKVDVLKMPHHGSVRNINMEFFQTVIANTYVYSANGKHDNPDAETLKLMRESRSDSDYTVIFSNEMKMQHEENQPIYDAEVQKLVDAGVTILTRDPDKHSICLELN